MQLKSLTLNKLPARFGSLERPRQCSAQRDKGAVFATDSTFLAVAKVFNNLDRLKIDNPPISQPLSPGSECRSETAGATVGTLAERVPAVAP